MAYLDDTDSVGFFAKIGDRGKELTAAYQKGEPFPHIVIDDFLPAPILDRCLADFPAGESSAESQFNRSQERLKFSFNPDTLSPQLRTLFYSFNSRPFLQLLENITGIKGLIGDPYFVGGGFHELRQGGHLSVHADFNYHRPVNLERRINVLIYLNKDWKDAYGGQLELWDKNMTQRVQSVVPLFNRCVIFNTTSNSMHGNPNPINHPQLISRKSIALYYYTATWDGTRKAHTTHFETRPNSSDKFDWAVKSNEFFEDIVPPIIFRTTKRVIGRVSRIAKS